MKLIKWIILILVLFFSGRYLSLKPSSFDSSLFDTCIVCVCLGLIYFIVTSQQRSGRGYWIKPSYLFVIGFVAVNFQYLLDLRLGLKSLASTRFLHETILNHCAVLGTIGLLSFSFGYGLKPLSNNGTVAAGAWKEYNNSRTNGVPTLLIALQFVLFVWFLLSSNISSYIDGSDYEADSTSNAESLLYVVNALIIVLISKQHSSQDSFVAFIKRMPIVSLIVFSVYIILRLMSGDRGPFVYSVLLLFWGYLYSSRKKIRGVVVVAGLFFGMLLITLVGIARGAMFVGSSFGNRMAGAYEQYTDVGRFVNMEASVCPFTDELGYSFFVNQVDVYAVEVKGEKLHYFAYPFYSIISGIPFMPGIIQNGLGVDPVSFSSGGFANYQFFGGYDRTWGIGTTILGDFYLSFGLLGVVLGLLLTGYILRYFDDVILGKNREEVGLYELLFVLLFASKSIYMPRASLLLDMPRFVWGVIILSVVSTLSGYKLSNK